MAEEAGYDDVNAFMKEEKFFPHHSAWERNSQGCTHTDMAGAVILCASDIAKKYHPNPIEIVGTGVSCHTGFETRNITVMNQEAFDRVYAETGVKPEEIDYLQFCDMFAIEQFIGAEACGYIPKGQAWQYALDGRTAYDGDRPINTNGGDLYAGHAYGCAGFPMVAEAVRQMRGQCGERQIKTPPPHDNGSRHGRRSHDDSNDSKNAGIIRR